MKAGPGGTQAWNVTVPITGVIYVTVEAMSKEDAIDRALDGELHTDDIAEWKAHRKVVEGHVFRGMCREADATLEKGASGR